MTATLTGSQAILKTKYPDGRLPTANYKRFRFISTVSKKEDFDGNNKVIALQTENPQGSSADFATALGSLAQGTYKNFTLTRTQHFGIARITGQALKAAAKNTGALVSLWQNETNGISATEMKCLEIYAFGNGTGVLGSISSGQTGTAITLSTVEDIVKFDLGMRVQAVSSATSLSPTTRSGYGTISSIDRKAGTLTISSGNWNDAGNIPGILSTDSLVRAGDGAASAAGVAITGIGQWVVGGTTPGTLFGLNRNTDPVRLAGQSYDATTVPYEDALIEAESLRNLQYNGGDLMGWFNPRDIAQMKKQLGGKATYPRTEMKSTIAGVSFSAIEVDGDDGPIKLMTSPFVSRNKGFLLDMDTFALESLGPAPQMLDFDGPNFLRVANDDAYEVRFGLYGNMSCNVPVASIAITNFGA
jgi:hypothetical protein